MSPIINVHTIRNTTLLSQARNTKVASKHLADVKTHSKLQQKLTEFAKKHNLDLNDLNKLVATGLEGILGQAGKGRNTQNLSVSSCSFNIPKDDTRIFIMAHNGRKQVGTINLVS